MICSMVSNNNKMAAIQKEMDEVRMPKIGAEAKAFSANYPTLNLAMKQKTLFIPRGGDLGGVHQQQVWYMELQIIPGAAGLGLVIMEVQGEHCDAEAWTWKRGVSVLSGGGCSSQSSYPWQMRF